MKTARLFFLSFALMVGAAAVAQAQQGPPGGGGGRGGMNASAMLLQNITLSAEQQVKVDTINAKFAVAQREMRARMQDGDRQAMMGEMRKMRATLQADLRAVLTAEQQAVFDKNVEEMAKRQQQRRRQQPPPALR